MASMLSNNAIVTSKNSLLTIPIQPSRYLVVEETRELYYDSDKNERFKLRDIQLLATDDARLTATAFAEDFYFVIETACFWYYDGTNWVQINKPLENITDEDIDLAIEEDVAAINAALSTTTPIVDEYTDEEVEQAVQASLTEFNE